MDDKPASHSVAGESSSVALPPAEKKLSTASLRFTDFAPPSDPFEGATAPKRSYSVTAVSSTTTNDDGAINAAKIKESERQKVPAHRLDSMDEVIRSLQEFGEINL